MSKYHLNIPFCLALLTGALVTNSSYMCTREKNIVYFVKILDVFLDI